MRSKGFLEKTPSRLLITMGGEEKVDRLAISIDGAVEVLPLAFDFDVRFIHSPTRADRAPLPFAESGLQLRREFLNPAINTGMIDVDAPLRHHFFQVPITQRVRKVPTDTRQDEVLFKTVASKVDPAGSQVRTGAVSLTEIRPSQRTQQNLK